MGKAQYWWSTHLELNFIDYLGTHLAVSNSRRRAPHELLELYQASLKGRRAWGTVDRQVIRQYVEDKVRRSRRTTPRPPSELVGAMQDRVHKEVGEVRVPRVAKRKAKKEKDNAAIVDG